MSNSSKLMEELKLYWLIQMSSAAALGFFIEKIIPRHKELKDLGDVLNLWSSVLAITLIALIAFIYNMLGTYFIYCARKNDPDCGDAEHSMSIMTPIINLAYFVIIGMLWASSAYKSLAPLDINNSSGVLQAVFVLALIALIILIFFLSGKSTLSELKNREKDGYYKYATTLLKFYFLLNKKKS